MKKHWLLTALIAVLVMSLAICLASCNDSGSTNTGNDGSGTTDNTNDNNNDNNNDTPDDVTPDNGTTDDGEGDGEGEGEGEGEENNGPAATVTDASFTYTLSEDQKSYTITAIAEGATQGIIPAKVNDIAVKTIDYAALAGNKLTEFKLDGNTNFKVDKGILYDKSGKTLLAYPGGKTDTTFKTANTVTAIGAYAFAGNTTLTSVELAKVKDIGASAFENCAALATITSASTRPETCGKNAFAGTAFYLNEENWTDGILYLAFGSYESKTRYLLIEAKDTVTGDVELNANTWCIADYAFYENANITSVSVHASLYSIGAYSFAKCSAMTAFTFSEYMPNKISTVYLGEGAYMDCTSLITYTLPYGVKTIRAYTFAGCTSMHYMLMKPEANGFDPTSLKGTPITHMFYDLLQSETTQVDPIVGAVTELQVGAWNEYFYNEDGIYDQRHRWWRYVDGVPTPWPGNEFED